MHEIHARGFYFVNGLVTFPHNALGPEITKDKDIVCVISQGPSGPSSGPGALELHDKHL